MTTENYHIFQEIFGIQDKIDPLNGDLILSFNEFNLKEAIIKIGEILIENEIISPFWKKQSMFDFDDPSIFISDNQENTFLRKYSSNVSFSYFGKSITYGDFDGDGIKEIAIGAPGYIKATGAVYLSKSHQDLDLNYSDPLLIGFSDYSRFGFSLTTVDLNHDGIDDLVVSAPTYGNNGPSPSIEEYYPKDYKGRIYIYFGRKGIGIVKNSAPDIEINTENELESFFNLGYSLESGDCNNDGYPDLLIGSPYSQRKGDKRGHVALFLSLKEKNKLMIEEADLTFSGSQDYEELGYSLGCKDNKLYIGAPGARFNLSDSYQASGLVYIVDIQSKSIKNTIISDKPEIRFGASLDISSNILAVGAPSYDVINTKYNFHNGVVFLYKIDKILNEEISINDYYGRIESKENRSRFGKKVKFIDNKLIISAPQYTKNIFKVENGRVYIFDNFVNIFGEVDSNKADKIIEGNSNGGRLGENVAFNSIDTSLILLSAPYTTKTDLAGEILLSTLN